MGSKCLISQSFHNFQAYNIIYIVFMIFGIFIKIVEFVMAGELAPSLTRFLVLSSTSLSKAFFFCHHVKYSFTKSTHSKGFCFLFLLGFLCKTPSASFAFSLGLLSLLESKIKLKDMGGTCSLALALPLALCKALFMLFRFEWVGGTLSRSASWDNFLGFCSQTKKEGGKLDLGK